MENIVISNSENFEKLKEKIINKGSEKFHVLADFDRTLTYAYDEKGDKVPSLISVLRDGDYISPEYAKKAHELFDKYHPIEIDSDTPLEEKKKAMKQWWTEHFDLLIESGLKKNHLEQIVDSGVVRFRDGTLEFIDYLHDKNIPLVILSSSGVGNALKMFIEKQGRLYDNVHIITNNYEFDEEGNAVSVNEPIIHSLNKDETSVQNYLVFEKIKDRKNVLLLGDGIGDLGMITGFECDNLIKIGFLNDNVKENLKRYKENFDVVITNDSDMNYVNELVKEI